MITIYKQTNAAQRERESERDRETGARGTLVTLRRAWILCEL